jgi:uncharacterized heparinase superfamily protein
MTSFRFATRRLRYALHRPIYATGLYRLTLPRRARAAISFMPADLWPGNSNRGDMIAEGNFEYGGKIIRDAEAPWLAAGVADDWRADVSRFEWLRDLRASGGEAARARARALVQRWMESYDGQWNALTWRPDVTGARLANWLSHYEFVANGASAEFLDTLNRSLVRQVRHLKRTACFAEPGLPRILALKGLILSSLAWGVDRKLKRRIQLLEHEIAEQILADGGHVSRNPENLLEFLRHLVDIRGALRDAQIEVSSTLQTAIDRIAPMLRFFRHGDGGLALFNGGRENEGWLVDVALTRSEARGKPLESAPHSGFERLTANRTLLLVDTGLPAPMGYDRDAHAGTLSFEMSVGKERLVVNCGAYRGDNASWRTAQRTTAAHSTLTVEDNNSAEILAKGGIGKRGNPATTGRKEADDNIWLDASYDGYRSTLGVSHTRRLYLSASGGDFRGEDSLEGKGNHKFSVRFHLHPTVRASLIKDGNAVLIRLPSGTGWRFRASGGVITLQESVYLGQDNEIKRSEQIAVSSATRDGEGLVKWAFSRLSEEAD